MTNDKALHKAVPVLKFLAYVQMLKKAAEEERDKIGVGTCDAMQRNWHFFNGKSCALGDIISWIRMWIETFPPTDNSEDKRNGDTADLFDYQQGWLDGAIGREQPKIMQYFPAYTDGYQKGLIAFKESMAVARLKFNPTITGEFDDRY